MFLYFYFYFCYNSQCGDEKMTDNKRVSNLHITNKMFAKYLQEERFVLPDDVVIEATESISDSIAFSLEDNGIKSIFLNSAGEEEIRRSFEVDSGVKNFICNGVSSSIDFCVKNVLGTGAFNVGICTNDEHEFCAGKKFYQGFYRKLVALGVPVRQIEDYLEEGKVYFLSYRAWK